MYSERIPLQQHHGGHGSDEPKNKLDDIRLWTLDGSNSSKEEVLNEEQMKSRLDDYVKKSEANKGENLPNFSLFTTHGDSSLRSCEVFEPREPRPVEDEQIGFDFLTKLFPRTVQIRKINRAAVRPVFTCYRDDGFITIFVRLSRSVRNIFCFIKIHHTPHLRSVSFISCKDPSELAEVRKLCLANQELLCANPLALLSFLYDQIVRAWEEWERDLFVGVNEIEIAHGMAPEGWWFHLPSSGRVESLTDDQALSSNFAQLHTQICHGRSMAEQGVRFARFCLDVANIIENEAGTRLGRKRIIEDHIRATESLCHAVLERFNDLGDRVRGLMSIMNNSIALKEMKINRVVAINSLEVTRRTAVDGRIMKILAVLGALFLPATFTSSLWQAGVFDIQGQANFVVYAVVTVVLTITAATLVGLYMRSAERSATLQRYELKADPAMV